MHVYSPVEERMNIWSHAVGFVLSLAAFVALVLQATRHGTFLQLASFAIFGLSLVLMYGVSTVYHGCTRPERRCRLRIYDHVSIYVLIAGTYTPFALITVQGSAGWALFAMSWLMALAGTVMKLFFTGRYRLLSTLMYVGMGWMILLFLKPLTERLVDEGLAWLIAGGVAYSVGALLYSVRTLPFNHASFHALVLLGSACHFMAVYYFLLPGT